jgi:myosin protein heavy chain
MDRELNQALTELKNREWQVKQLESRQDKTIVEHVHVLEEAKRVTDRQLADAQQELQRQTAYIKSLESAKTRLAGEAEDLAREAERERMVRARAGTVQVQEERTAKALRDVEKERHAKDVAELQTRRMEGELQNALRQINELSQQLSIAHKAKADLESDLEKVLDEANDASQLTLLNQRLAEELEDEKNHHQKDLEDTDFAVDQTRKKYQGEPHRNSRVCTNLGEHQRSSCNSAKNYKPNATQSVVFARTTEKCAQNTTNFNSTTMMLYTSIMKVARRRRRRD